MNWLQKSLSVIACINIAVAPAFAKTEWTEKEKSQLSQYRDYLEPMGYRLQVDHDAKKALVYDKNTNKLSMEIPFAQEKELRKFSPKNINQMLLDEMVKVKSASKSAFSHSVRNLPTESAMFFMAMGAVVAGQLIMNYSQNPLAMQQHIEHSMSPLGVFGFFTFMYSQGVTSNILAMYLKNPKFHHMIPYLGMTVGFTVQSYLSQIAMDPNVKACAKVMMGGKLSEKDKETGVDEDPCDKAYDYLIIKKKLWEFAPGMVSMITSALLAAVGQKAVTSAVLRLTGVDIALWLVPGSMQLKGFRLLVVKGLQISAFVAIDVWLHQKVNYAWKNFFDGKDFIEYNQNLNARMNDMKKANWNADPKALQDELKNFKTKMMDWRMMNLTEVYEAHTNWSTALHQLTAMFNTSYAFYNTMANELRNSRFQESPNRPLDMTTPFYGVAPKDLADGKEDLYLSNAKFIETLQAETVADAIPKIEEYLTTSQAKYMFPHEKKDVQEVLRLLKTDDHEQMGLGLKKLNTMIFMSATNVASSQGYYYMLTKIRGFIGEPTPLLEKGRGFVEAYMKAPSTAETTKGTNYYRKVGIFQTPKITDYLVMQMVCGPDVEHGEAVVKNSAGFPSVFLPPRIADADEEFNVCNSIKADLPVDRIYNFPVTSSVTGKKYSGFLSYLVAEARESALGGKDQANFPEWWAKTTEKAMKDAFEKYSKSYDEIVVKLVQLTYKSEYSAWNRGPMANGTMNAAFQEERVYLAVLNELLQPSASFNVQFGQILAQAPTRASLIAVEDQFAILNGLIKQIKVSQVDGRPVVQSPLENYQLEEQVQNIQIALGKVANELGVGDDSTVAAVTLNKQQRDLAVTTLEYLQGLASEIMMYGSMANAVSWDKIRNLKRLNIEQGQFNNEIQAKLNQMRGLSAPGRP